MSQTRNYGVFGRSPLPRNKYGAIYDFNLINSGGSATNNIYGGNKNDVGGSFTSLNDFKGATEFDPGVRGLVPAPAVGEQLKFLQGNGAWTDIPAFRWLKEFPESEGLEKSGLTIDGDFNVGNTLTTMNLNVEGAAHFWSLIIDEVKANGGQVLVSPSMFRVDFIGDILYYPVFTSDSPMIDIISTRKDIDNTFRACNVTQIKCRRVWQRNDDGATKINNEVQVGDMLRCRSFNIEPGVYHNVSNTDYWTFVVKVGDGTYIDENNEEKKGFWIDLVYGLRTYNGENIPLDSVLRKDGTFTRPSSWTGDIDIDRLKSVSNETLTGDRNVEHEEVDSEEYTEIENKVIAVRGIDGMIKNITGTDSTRGLTSDELSQVQWQLQNLNYGTEPTTADNAASMVLYGTGSDNVITPTSETEEYEASLRSGDIQGRSLTPTDSTPTHFLSTDKVTQSELVISEGYVSDREFIAAENLYDINGNLSYTAGSVIGENVTFLNDWRVIDTEKEDIVLEKPIDNPSAAGTVPENENEIINQTDNTGDGKLRDVDYYLNVDLDDVDEFRFGYGDFRIKVGDSLACLGHLYLSERQNAIVLSAQDPIDPELKAPAIAQYKGIYLFGESISKFRMTAIAANGNEFIGSFLVNYNNTYVEINDRINMFINDINTGLEKVGIHLDGENSTIKMVGNIELRQHSNNSYDTFSVFDNLDTKRVEILPKPIPTRNVQNSTIYVSDLNFSTISDSKNVTFSYIEYNSGRQWWFWPFNSSMWYDYTLNYYKMNYTTSLNLGKMGKNDVLDLSSLKIVLKAKTYLCSSVEVTDRGGNNPYKQSVDTLSYKLKKNGTVIREASLKNESGYYVTGLNTDGINISVTNTFLNDYIIPDDGTYSIDLTIGFTVYAYYRSWEKAYNNYYYQVRVNSTPSIRVSIDRKSLLSSNNMDGRMMTIGTNGLYFQGNNSRYFYAADDGFELYWDGAGMRIDSNSGLRETRLSRTVSTTTYLDNKYDFVIATATANGYTVYLPTTNGYGNGRRLIIIGFQGLKVICTNSEVMTWRGSNGDVSGTTLEFLNGASTSLIMPKYVVELISAGGTWWIISYY